MDRKDSKRTGRVLGRAFFDTEQWIALMPDPSIRKRKLIQMFTGTVKPVLACSSP